MPSGPRPSMTVGVLDGWGGAGWAVLGAGGGTMGWGGGGVVVRGGGRTGVDVGGGGAGAR